MRWIYARERRPLRRVDVHEVDHHVHVGQRSDVLRHGRRERHRAADAVSCDRVAHPPGQAVVAVVAERERLAREQAAQAAHARTGRADRRDVQRRAQRPERARVHAIGLVVDERAEVHGVARGEEAQQMMRANLVALVGRIRDAVREVEQRLHGQPRFRTMCGPSAVATPRGSRRHSAMKARYFGLAGLFCGTALKRRRRCS